MQIKLKLPSTRVTGLGCEWFPENFTTFKEELNHIVSYGRHTNRFFLFRGQKNYEWLLDSTIARSIKKILDVDPPYKLVSHIQCLPWVNALFGWLLIYKFRVRTQPSEELFEQEKQQPKIDPYFEWMKRLQQYSEEDLANIKGTFLVDWTQNPDVALFFANAERDDDVPGAVFIADSTAMGLILHRDMKVDCMLDLYEDAISGNEALGCPIIFCPREQLLQQRPKNQDAIYFAQMDLRYDLTELWASMMNERQDGELLFIKLRLPPGSSMECNDWLERKGITKSFLFPDEE